jgi:hypothetical protein
MRQAECDVASHKQGIVHLAAGHILRYHRRLDNRTILALIQGQSISGRDHLSGGRLYYRFSLSYREVEELMAARAIMLTYETIRQWCRKFGQYYANQVRQRRARPSRPSLAGHSVSYLSRL